MSLAAKIGRVLDYGRGDTSPYASWVIMGRLHKHLGEDIQAWCEEHEAEEEDVERRALVVLFRLQDRLNEEGKFPRRYEEKREHLGVLSEMLWSEKFDRYLKRLDEIAEAVKAAQNGGN